MKGELPIILLILISLQLLLPLASKADTTVESDLLEYDAKNNTYRATGKVRIIRDSTTIDADEVLYNEKTQDVYAHGNVLYIDPDVKIRASKAFVNIDKKTGKLLEAEIFYKKNNYHIKGNEIDKTSEKEYFLKGATFTSCDAPLPAWCFKGRDVQIVLDEKIKARDVTFNIKNFPVFYTPYYTAPLRERKTGFLLPSIGYVESKGLHYEQPFFWAISENRDATLTIDIFGKRGIGEGLEYRHLEYGGLLRGNYWVYHLRDDKLKSDFWDIKGLFEMREGNITVFANLNYINSLLYYREYNSHVNTKKAFLDPESYLNITTGRFFESTAEVKYLSTNSSLFLQSRYLIDLKEGVDQSTVIQTLPSIGYYRYPERIGPFTFTFSATATNFYRGEKERGLRFDLYPRFTHSYGDTVRFTQSLGLRSTLYSLSRSEDFNNRFRTGFDYSLTALTELKRSYESLTHIVEPAIEYTFIPSLRDVPLFDEIELYSKTSRLNLSVMNRFISNGGEFLTLRVSQPFDIHRGDRPLLPLSVETAIKGPLAMRGEFSYDPNKGSLEDLNSDLTLGISDLLVSLGERYKKTEEIFYYSLGLKFHPIKNLSYEGYLWYDAKTRDTKNIVTKINYQRQCWGITAIAVKRERDYSFSLLFHLLGIGTVKL